jgi:hypothetical protein
MKRRRCCESRGPGAYGLFAHRPPPNWTQNRDPVLKALSQRNARVQPFWRRLYMKRKANKRKFSKPKTKLGLPDLDQSKTAVLGSLRSPESQRGYRHAIDEFIEWYCSEPRLSFNRTVVLRYRMQLEYRNLAAGHNQRTAGCGSAIGVRGR